MIYMKRLVVALVAAMFMIWPSLQAADGNVKARQLAKFQDEASQLASLWIEYALGDPDFVPNLEEGTVDCQLNQPQPSSVTILTGNFSGGETVRSCTVPADVPLFFPILNCFFINFEDENFSVEEKVAICEEFVVDNQCDMEVTLDGLVLYPTAHDVPLLRTISHPTLGFFPFTEDFDPETIASGHWALIQPLSAGPHTVEFRGSTRGSDGLCNSDGFSLDVTYLLTVED